MNRSAWSPPANLQNRCFVYTKPPFSRMALDLQNCESGIKDLLIGRISAPEMQTWGRNERGRSNTYISTSTNIHTKLYALWHTHRI